MIYLGNNCNCIWNLYCFFVKFKRYKYMIFFTFCFLLSLSHKYKMAQLVPFYRSAPQTFIWSLTAALQLIRERRVLNTTFITNRNHTAAWNQVATNIFAATRFVCTSDQCCSKWNTLKGDMKIWNKFWGIIQIISLCRVQITLIMHVSWKCLINFGCHIVINFKFII